MLKSTLLIIIVFIIIIIMALMVLLTGFDNKSESFGSSDWVGEWKSLSQPYVFYYDSDFYPQYDRDYLKLNYQGSNQSRYQ
jgi:hypothetical protein